MGEDSSAGSSGDEDVVNNSKVSAFLWPITPRLSCGLLSGVDEKVVVESISSTPRKTSLARRWCALVSPCCVSRGMWYSAYSSVYPPWYIYISTRCFCRAMM